MAKKKVVLVVLIILLLVIAAAVIIAINLQSKDLLLFRNPLLIRDTPVLTNVEGECYYRENPENEWIDAQVGSKIKLGYELKTMRNSRMDIRLHEDTVVRITDNSNLVINELTLKTLTLDLKEGQLYGRFHRIFKDQSMNIRTPTTIASVRGTELAFEVEGSGSTALTDVYSLSGITEIKNSELPDNAVLLANQGKTMVAAGKAPTTPVELEAEEIERLSTIIKSINENQVLLITNLIQFDPDTADITEESIPELEKVAAMLGELKKRQHITISGHTADVGTPESQYQLSVARAERIKEYLIESGLAEERINTVGYGGEKPVATNDTQEGRALNRRVEFHIDE